MRSPFCTDTCAPSERRLASPTWAHWSSSHLRPEPLGAGGLVRRPPFRWFSWLSAATGCRCCNGLNCLTPMQVRGFLPFGTFRAVVFLGAGLCERVGLSSTRSMCATLSRTRRGARASSTEGFGLQEWEGTGASACAPFPSVEGPLGWLVAVVRLRLDAAMLSSQAVPSVDAAACGVSRVFASVWLTVSRFLSFTLTTTSSTIQANASTVRPRLGRN